MKVEERQINLSDFAKALNCSRSSVYNMFSSRDISLLRLIEVGKILEYDFISEICRQIYRERIEGGEVPFISIPVKDGKPDFSKLPREIYNWLTDTFDDV
jgi:AcrR family transcriptional regulator